MKKFRTDGTIEVNAKISLAGMTLKAFNKLTDGDLDSVDVVWQWQFSVDGKSWSDIPGANSSTFNVTASEASLLPRAVGTYSDQHGTYSIDSAQWSTMGTQGADIIVGKKEHNIIAGLGGNDTILGGKGNDAIKGGNGNDWISGEAGDDQLWGDAGNDTLLGGKGNDMLNGGTGNDILDGGAGDDLLYGAWGVDTLIGGKGADQFNFADFGGGVDKIVDFESGTDVIRIQVNGFKGLSVGEDPNLVVNGTPEAGQASFVYSTVTGLLSWDPDGAGGMNAIGLAVFENKAQLASSDFILV